MSTLEEYFEYIRGCSVHQGIFCVLCRGYLESYVGVIMNTLIVFSTLEGYNGILEGYHEYMGNI